MAVLRGFNRFVLAAISFLFVLAGAASIAVGAMAATDGAWPNGFGDEAMYTSMKKK